LINPNPKLNILMEDFALYIDEYDYRRKTQFSNTFPQLIPFYNRCKTLLTNSGRPRNLRKESVVKIVSEKGSLFDLANGQKKI